MALGATCSSCAHDVCVDQGWDECCTTYWSYACIQAAEAFCPKVTCGSSSSSSSSSGGGTLCGDGPCSCAHDECTVGGPLSATCSPCVQTLCEDVGDNNPCCTSKWSSFCVDEVDAWCDFECPL